MSYTSLHEQSSLSIPPLHFSDAGPSSRPRLSSPMAKAVTDSRFNDYLDTSTYPTLSARNGATLLRRVLWALVPSFIQARYSTEPARPAERLHPTAFLDGMRGLAAFAVFLSHAAYQTFDLNKGYGYGEPGEHTRLLQLPVVRLLYHGPPMVAIFFVISGFALAYKPLRLMRARAHAPLLAALSSSVFRRGLRLYLPCFASTLLVAAMCQLGWFRATQAQFDALPVARPDHHAATLATPRAQLADWAAQMADFVQFFNFMVYAGSVSLDRHLWTIPTEFRASLVLFLSLLLTARLRPAVRIAVYAALMYWVLRWNRWEMVLFFAGALFAELTLLSSEKPAHSLSSASEKPAPPRSHPAWRYLAYLAFSAGLYVASYPEEGGADTPGYRWLGARIPAWFDDKMRFWPLLGALLIVGAVCAAPALRAPFASPPAQYLGSISFALYLVHGPVIHTLGYALMAVVYPRAGIAGAKTAGSGPPDETEGAAPPRWHPEAGFALVLLLTTAAVICIADVFWRCVDLPCVRFARWLEARLIVREEDPLDMR